MTMLTSPRPLPRKDADSAPLTATDVAVVLQRSNHATTFAAWTVVTIATGLVVQVDTVRAIGSRPAVLLLAGLLLPVLVTASRAAILVVRAGRAVRHAETTDTGAVSDASPAPAGPDLVTLLDGQRRRDALARRAETWAAASGIAFLAWSLLVALLPAGG
jgi:hypothetical protein